METYEYFTLALFILAGVFSLLASCLNWDWFFTAQKAEYTVKSLGRTGARIFYGLLGLALIVCGVLGVLYWR